MATSRRCSRTLGFGRAPGGSQVRSCFHGELRRDLVVAARRDDSDRLGTRPSALRRGRSPSRGLEWCTSVRRIELAPRRFGGGGFQVPVCTLRRAGRGIPVARWQHRSGAALTGAERSSWSNAPLTRPPVATVEEGRVDFHVEGTLKGNKAQRKDRACRTGNGANTLRTRRRSKASKSASKAQMRVDGSTWQRVSQKRDDASGGTARGQRPW